jgi:hypothetical protein
MKRSLRCGIALALLVLMGCQQAAPPATGDSWAAYAKSVDDLVATYVAFNEPDAGERKLILANYEQAKKIREEYHRTGEMADSPLVIPISQGATQFKITKAHVAVILAEDPTLECRAMRIDKPKEKAGHFVVIGGSKRFWIDRRPEAKFISAAFTLPDRESSLDLSSQSWSPGKVIVAFLIGATLTLSGCDPPQPPPPPAPVVTCSTIPAPNKPKGWTGVGAKCAPNSTCTGGRCVSTITSTNEANKTITWSCDCK